jgi:hypothetical protein
MRHGIFKDEPDLFTKTQAVVASDMWGLQENMESLEPFSDPMVLGQLVGRMGGWGDSIPSL